MKKPFLSLLLISSFLFSSAQINTGISLLDTVTVYKSWQFGVPWELKWGPDNHLWLTERAGQLIRINPNDFHADTVLDHRPFVWHASEAGMLGMDFHPNFPGTPLVYVVYAYLNGLGESKMKLVHFTWNGTVLVNEQVVFDGMTSQGGHNGSRLQVLSDNTILLTTGDVEDISLPQNSESLQGKVLRMNLDGSVPADNPHPGSYVYTKGHRNPQGLLAAPNGRVYYSEHGPSSDDEFGILQPGRNYGWYNVFGWCNDNNNGNEAQYCLDSNVAEPLLAWTPTIAPSDLAWYGSSAIPEFSNSVLMVCLKDMKLKRIVLSPDGASVLSQTDFFTGVWGRLRDVAVGPDGSIYLATNQGHPALPSPRVVRLRNQVILPVAVTGFTGVYRDRAVELKWQAAAGISLSGFELWRSSDGGGYARIGFVPARTDNGEHYIFRDADPGLGRYRSVQYKLIERTADGRDEAAGLVSIRLPRSLDLVRPAGQIGSAGLMLQTSLQNGGSLGWELYNVQGSRVAGGQLEAPPGVNRLVLTVPPIASGVYLLRVLAEDGERLYSGWVMKGN